MADIIHFRRSSALAILRFSAQTIAFKSKKINVKLPCGCNRRWESTLLAFLGHSPSWPGDHLLTYKFQERLNVFNSKFVAKYFLLCLLSQYVDKKCLPYSSPIKTAHVIW